MHVTEISFPLFWSAGAFAGALGFLGFFFYQVWRGIEAYSGRKDVAGLLSSAKDGESASEDYAQYEYMSLETYLANHRTSSIEVGEPTLQKLRQLQQDADGNTRHYILYYLDVESRVNRYVGLATIRTVNGIMKVQVNIAIKGLDKGGTKKRIEGRKLSEGFIINEVSTLAVGRSRGRPHSRRIYGILFERRYVHSRRMSFLLPNYIAIDRSPSKEKISKLASQTLGKTVEHPKYLFLVPNKFTWSQKRDLYAAACSFSHVYLAMQIWCFLSQFTDQIITGLVLAAILNYVQELGVLAAYEWITYVVGIVIISIFVSPIFAKKAAEYVLEGRDIRVAEEGHFWERKVQHQRVLLKLMKHLFACAFLKGIAMVLFFILVPATGFLGAYGSEALFHIVNPSLYLTVYLAWWLFDNLANTYESEFYGEVEHRSLAANIEAREKGFSALNDIIDNFGTILIKVIGAAGLLLGIGIITAGWNAVVVPLLIGLSMLYIVQSFVFPLWARDYRLYVNFPGKEYEKLPNGNFHISENVELQIRPQDRRMIGVYPMKMSPQKTRLPWVEKLGVTIIFGKSPYLRPKGRGWIVSVGTTNIEIGKVLGRVIRNKDFILRDNVLTVCPQAREISSLNAPFSSYALTATVSELLWLLYLYQGEMEAIAPERILRLSSGNNEDKEAAQDLTLEVINSHLSILASLGLLVSAEPAVQDNGNEYELSPVFANANPSVVKAAIGINLLDKKRLTPRQLEETRGKLKTLFGNIQQQDNP